MIPDSLTGSDWCCAFQCVGVEPLRGEPGAPPDATYSSHNTPAVSRVLGYSGSDAQFTRSDVAEVIASQEGENDGASWIALLRLADGRIAFVTAGCDYTGWDCQSGGHGIVGPDVDTMVRLALGDSDRDRLGDQIAKWVQS